VCSVYSIKVSDKGTIGILLAPNYKITMSYEGSKYTAGFAHLINTVRIIGVRFGELFSEAKTTGDYSEISNSVSGPVGIYYLINYFKDKGLMTFLSVMGDLSLSLAIMNLLPIPALDGGRVVILLIESIIRRDLNERIKTLIINGSFILLMILVIFIMIKDVLNIQNIKDMFR
jgi:regulator of sigma E protease